MRIGFGLPVAGSWATMASVRLVAERAQQLGYGSLWAYQRLLNPADTDWGSSYRSVQDPLIALAYAAALTDDVRLGVAVLNAPYYQPLLLAKQLTTLDVLSRGRLDVGLGLGWAQEEFEAVGVKRDERVGRTREMVRCLEHIWGPDPVRFEGEFFRIPESVVQPKPMQKPRPPLLMGGAAEPALRRVGRLADGWISASRQDLRGIGAAIRTIRLAAADAGRDESALRFVVRGVVRPGREITDRDGARRLLTGSTEVIRDDIESLGGEGVTELFIDPNFNPDMVSPDMEPERSLEMALAMMDALRPHP